jgi:hypothetical protein
MPGISIQEITRRGRLLKTGQTTCYAIGDDGDVEAGLDKAYYVYTVGSYAGTSNIEVAHYAAATLSFAAPNTIADAAGGLAGWAVNDVMVIKGSANNDGAVTVTGIGGVPNNLTISAAVNELAGAVISLYKRVAHSNNCVFDRRTGRMWSRYTSNGEKVGPNSTGTLNWYNVATVFTLHGAAADLQMIAPDTLRIVGGAGEVNAYHEGDLLDCAGFANAVNNLPGYYVEAVAVNGADLDITLDPSNQTLVSEAAGGARSIGLVCRSCFNYAAGARLTGLAGYTDWRVPNTTALLSLCEYEAPSAIPDAVAFPGWPADYVVSSQTTPNVTANRLNVTYLVGQIGSGAKTGTNVVALVRG